jgi:glycosyltransferase involved in cell wall biosynthesis
MRIAYYAHVNGGSRSGVFHKMAGQARQWRAAGHAVRVFVATRDDAIIWESSFDDAVVHQYERPMSRVRAMVELVRAVRRYDPDIVYLRWDLFYPSMLWFPRHAALVVEINTDDLHEYVLGPHSRSLYNAHTRDIVLRRARALVFVTSELSNSPSFRRDPGRRCVITNGIDLSAYPVLAAPVDQPPRLVFVGTAGQAWHGIDKLLTLASKRPAWRFDIVGMHEEQQASIANVTWHGPLERAQVLDVLAHADVGVGTLALHRKSMAEACPLKVREYLAVGLPVLYGYKDPDADGLGSYALRIANTESNVVDELARIHAFVVGSQGVRVPRSSVAHIDVTHKERQRLALFDDIAAI